MFNSQLTVFVCVADCGSFNKAAEKLYISPPSVMKQINALEKHLDLKLLDRTNQGIHLTAAGQVIYRHAKYLFDYSAKAIEEARRGGCTAGNHLPYRQFSFKSLQAFYGSLVPDQRQIPRLPSQHHSVRGRSHRHRDGNRGPGKEIRFSHWRLRLLHLAGVLSLPASGNLSALHRRAPGASAGKKNVSP